MDASINDTEHMQAQSHVSEQWCSTSSALKLPEQNSNVEQEDSASPPGMECAQLFVAGDNPDASDELWPPSLTADFIEQCVQTLDAIQDSNCLAISDDQLSLLCPSIVSLQGQEGVVSLNNFGDHISLENIWTGDTSILWPSINGTEMAAPGSVSDRDCTLSNDSALPPAPDRRGDISSQWPTEMTVPGTPAAIWSAAAIWSEPQQDGVPAAPLEPLVWHRASADMIAPSDPAQCQPSHPAPHLPVGSDARCGWRLAPAAGLQTCPTTDAGGGGGGAPGWWRPGADAPPPPPPAAAARLAEVECELTVSEEAELEVAPPAAGSAAVDLAPYQEHNYDYPLEPLVAGEVRPSADHQYASRPASPGGDACSATDHRYAYSPPAALTEEDLIRSISDQLGLPQDHGYSQRQSAAPTQPPPPPPQGTGRAVSEPRGAEPCLVMESCTDWEPTLDESTGHWVDPNLVMGLTTAWQEQQAQDDGLAGPGAALIDESLDDSEAALLAEAGPGTALLVEERGGRAEAALGAVDPEYVTLDVAGPKPVVLDDTLNGPGTAVLNANLDDQDSVLDVSIHAPESAVTDEALVGRQLVMPCADTELTHLLWPVAGSSLASHEANSAPPEAELSPTLPDSPEVEVGAPLETNIVISRAVVSAGSPLPPASPPPSPPSARLPAPDAAAAVRGWLRRRAAARQPVTRSQLRQDLAALLGPDRHRRLAESSAFLAQWLARCAAEDGTDGTPAGGKHCRLSYPPYFKLLVLRFTEFMPPDAVAAAFCVPFSLVYKWRSKRSELFELARSDGGCVRAKGGGKKRKETEVDVEFGKWLEQRAQESATQPCYEEIRQVAKRMYAQCGLKVPRSRLRLRDNNVTSRRRDENAVRWLLSEFECGGATTRAALTAYGQQPGGLDWSKRLLARYPELRQPLCTWNIRPPEPLLSMVEEWAGGLELPPRNAVCFVVDVPIMEKPAPCAVWKSEGSERLATLLISCSLEGSVLPPMLILKGVSRRVYSDSSGLLTAQQEAGRLDAARAGLWLQLVGGRGPSRLLLLNTCCAPRPDELRRQAAAAGRQVALVPPGLAAVANPLMASRQRLMVSIAAALEDGGADSDLLVVVRAQLAVWRDSGQLIQDLARVDCLYSVPPAPDS